MDRSFVLAAVRMHGSRRIGFWLTATARLETVSTIPMATIAFSTLPLNGWRASSKPLRFRPKLSLLAELSAIEGADDFLPLGTLPREWLAVRMMGSAKIDGTFADLYAASWVSHLRKSLAADALRLGVKDIDLSTLENAQPRRLTQLASRQAYRLKFDGIFYHSRYGHSLENWAIFEPFPLENAISEALSEDDPDLMEALRIHAIHLD